MTSPNRRAGTLSLQINGNIFDAVGNFSYNLGAPKREALVGPDRVHGFKELPQAPMIEGEIRDAKDLDLKNAILNAVDATVTITLANGKVVMLREAYYSGDGNIGTEEANVEFSFHGMSAEEII